MPEIKNTFTKGKMNLDLDERLVPNGEYKEALNIQVSTSDGSDIGSAQNILGNTALETIIGADQGYQCVGSIADEKNNKLYWFITNDTTSAIMEYDVDLGRILEADATSTVIPTVPILVDLDNSALEFNAGNQITGINVVDNFLFWTDGENEPKKINIDTLKLNNTGNTPNHSDLTVHSNMYVSGTSVGNVKKEHITVIKKRPTQAPTMDLVYAGQDSSSSGVLSASIDFSSYSVGSNVTIAITLNTFVVQSSGTGLALDYTDVSGAVTTAGALSSDLYDALEYSFEEDDILLLSDPAEIGVLPNNAQVRALITSTSTATARTVTSGSPDVFVQTITVKILSIDSNTPADDINYNFQVEDLNDLLFNTSFPRFSYRYKYEDGEYSAFGPFTQVGFAAGEFSIHPTKKPYNSAMENRVKQIKLREFVTHDIPDGVVEIDLLYKPDNSTNVYSIDTVKPKLASGTDNKEWTLYDIDGATDIAGPTLPDGSTVTASSTGCYIVKTENIYASLPSNQLLRPWDNVPKKAQAQDFTANRLIYGNYTQNLKLGDYDNKLTLRPEERTFGDRIVAFEKGQPSIKSQRTYQSGIVFGDEYGRETPVLTGGKNGSTKIIADRTPSSVTFTGNASRSNRFYFKNLTNIAGKANWDSQENEPYYFKVFIKETASEYYNLVMDRVYRAEEDGNLWISFPSSDRNKLQEDDYIILKKALESDNQVAIENKFKVIDIKNEAPEFIRKKYQQLGQADGNGTLSELYSNGAVQPFGGSRKIILNKESLIEEDINDLQSGFDNGEKISITFSVSNSSISKNSKRYNIISLTTEGSNPEFYNITFDKAIVNQDSWVETSAGVLDPALKTSIWKESIQEWEEFQGRFFVKIISDIITDQYLETQIGVASETSLVARASLFYLGDSNLLAYTNSSLAQKDPYTNITNTGQPLSNTAGIWSDNLKFDKAIATSGWFIDSAYTAAQQPTVLTDTSIVGVGSSPWGWNSNGSVPNNFAGINDVSVSGNLFKQGGASNSGRFGGAVNGVEGIITSYAATSDSASGARMWKRQVDEGNDFLENVYGPDGSSGSFFMHLSFSGVGVDLHNGTGLTNTNGESNINSGLLPVIIQLQSIHNYNQQNNLWPSGAGDQKTLEGTSNPSGMDIVAAERQWDPTYQHPENIDIVSNLVQGSKFQFNNDANNTVFTIKSVTIKHLYNHTGWNQVNELDAGTSQNSVERVNTVNYLWKQFKSTIDIANWNLLQNAVKDFGSKSNRRVCYILELDKDPTDSEECSINPETLNLGVSTFLNFQQNYVSENSSLLSDNPAVWETEPKDTSDLDIYYEASNAIPIRLDTNAASATTAGYDAPDDRKGHMIAPIGSAVRCSKAGSHDSTPGYKDCVVESWDGNIITLNPGLNVVTDFEIPDGSGILPSEVGYTTTHATTDVAGQTLAFSPETLKFYRDDLSYVDVGIFSVMNIASGLITKLTLDRVINQQIGLPYFNCFSFGNGVESNRIRDDFNKPFISNGVKASSTLQEQYLEDHRSSGLIYSGLYSKNSSLNSLNQFIMAEKITKDLLPTYGSIQKLFARDSDLIALCEDKIVQIFADKDALFNADGNTQLVSTNNVLGQSRPFVGEYGISKNPESFASSSYRAYFTDKQRGAVLRLSMDGLTPISDAGMHDWFGDKMKGGYFDGKIIGSYDSTKDNYNLTFDAGASVVAEESVATDGTYSFNNAIGGTDADFKSISADVTVTYKEDVKGWVSFKSFIPESGLSVVDTYFTFRDGKAYSHDNETRNTFYGTEDVNRNDSFITAIFNESPTTIKHFNTLNYDGLNGWSCDNITTDSEVSTIAGFVNKENKYFATIVGDDTADDLSSFNFQGIGTASSIDPIIITP